MESPNAWGRSKSARRWFGVLAIAFTALALGSAAFLALVAIPNGRERALATWETQLVALAHDRELAVERYASELATDGATLAQYPTAQYVAEGRSGPPYPFDPELGPEAHLRELFQRVDEVHGYSRTVLFDTAGRVLVEVGREVSPGGRDHTALVLEAGRTGTPQIRIDADPPVIAHVTPVRNAEGEPAGAVLIEVDPQPFLLPLVTELPIPTRTGETLLVTARGDGLVYLTPRRDTSTPGFEGAPDEDLAASAAIRGTGGVGRYRDYRGQEVLAATARIDGTPWALVAKIDVEEALSANRQEQRSVASAVLALLVGALGVFTGVWLWQRQKFAARVLEERARFAAVLDNANDPIFFLDEEGRILDFNRRAEEFYGYSRSELRGKRGRTLRPSEDVLDADAHLSEALDRGTAVVEAEHLTADGRRVPVEISTRATQLDSRRIMVSIVRDIRDRRKAEAALRQTEERYRTLVQNLPDLILRFGRDHTLQFASTGPLSGELLSPDFQGRSVDALRLPPDQVGALDAAVGQAVETGELQELQLHVSRDQDRSFNCRVVPEPGPDGGVASVLAILHDTTEREQLARQLRQSQKMQAVGRLAGGVAHDFNNILTSIQGNASLVLEELGADSEVAPELAEILDSAERAASLTNQLLAFSRRQIFQPRIVDMAEIARGMENMLQRLIGEHIRLAVRDGQGPHLVDADPSQLEQVILNLAVNARDAMPDGGTLSIQVERGPWPAGGAGSEEGVYLNVADSGTGMDDATLERIFEPFFTTKEAGKGTGLGLSTVYGIVDQNGGQITVESEAGRGTLVSVGFPAADGPVPADPTEEAGPGDGQSALPDARILLVEDDDAVRRLARQVLVRRGFDVFSAASGEEALELARNGGRAPDVLITDMVMPGMDGRSLAEKVRSEYPACRVILMSGYTEDSVVREQQLDRHTVFMEKPFTPAELLKGVSSLLSRAG